MSGKVCLSVCHKLGFFINMGWLVAADCFLFFQYYVFLQRYPLCTEMARNYFGFMLVVAADFENLTVLVIWMRGER